MTEVYFLWEKPVKGEKASVFAYFPTIQHSNKLNTCYAHIGQHSACDNEYAIKCKQANFNEYCYDLLPELISQGYNDLKILNSQQIPYIRKATEFEIKLGYGGAFFRDFGLSKCVNPKTGTFKKWIKAEDGLRYYHY